MESESAKNWILLKNVALSAHVQSDIVSSNAATKNTFRVRLLLHAQIQRKNKNVRWPVFSLTPSSAHGSRQMKSQAACFSACQKNVQRRLMSFWNDVQHITT